MGGWLADLLQCDVPIELQCKYSQMDVFNTTVQIFMQSNQADLPHYISFMNEMVCLRHSV